MVVSLTEAAIIAFSFVAFAGLLMYFYRFSNKKLMEKISGLARSDEELVKSLQRIQRAKQNELREMKKRIESIEDKIDALPGPGAESRETKREKVTARQR